MKYLPNVAKKLYKYKRVFLVKRELEIQSMKNGASNLNVDGLNAEVSDMNKQRLHMYVGSFILLQLLIGI